MVDCSYCRDLGYSSKNIVYRPTRGFQFSGRYNLLADGTVQPYDGHSQSDYLLSDCVDGYVCIASGQTLSLEVTSDKPSNYKEFQKRVQEAGQNGRQLRMALFTFKELKIILFNI